VLGQRRFHLAIIRGHSECGGGRLEDFGGVEVQRRANALQQMHRHLIPQGSLQQFQPSCVYAEPLGELADGQAGCDPPLGDEQAVHGRLSVHG
jgi:hypothetical protein